MGAGLGLRGSCVGRAGCGPWDEVGLSLWGTALVCLRGLLEADLGYPVSLGTMNPKRQQGILVQASLCVAPAGLQKAGSPLVTSFTSLFCFARHNHVVSVFKPPGINRSPQHLYPTRGLKKTALPGKNIPACRSQLRVLK